METKKMTDAFGDKALSSWTPSGIQSTLSSIERTFQNCNQELAALQMGDCDYVFQAAAITEMTENMGYLQTYASSAPGYVYETLDQPLFENFKNNATETLSQIVLDDLETENTIGMEEHFAVSGKGTVYNSKRVKASLKFEDFLGLPAVEAEEGMPVLENVETVNEFAFLFRTDYDKMGQEDIETCIEAYLTAGEFNHTAYHPVKDFLSGLLDITIVKPLIESVTGYDMITGERLTETEQAIKLAGACVDLFTFGQGMLAIEGAGLVGKELCKALGKMFAVDMLSGAATYTVGYGCAEIGMSPETVWLLSVITGCTISTVGNKFMFKDVNGNVTTRTVEEVIEDLEDGIYSGDLMSAEEAARYSEHWRELGIGSDNTWKAFKNANPNGTIDDYFEIVQKQSPWPLGETGTPITLKSGDRFFMAVENNAPENVIGGFGVKERIDSTDFVRNNLAVKYDWKTSCNVIREFEVNSGIELNVNAGPVGPQIDLGADLYLPGDTTITQYDLFSNLGSGIKREDYVHIVDEYWVD